MSHKWNTDFASDRPEHARRQSLRPQVEQAERAVAELPDSIKANAHMEGCPHEGFASPTGPDTRQADMDWRSIESAPRDGSPFLAVSGIWCTVACWNRHRREWCCDAPGYPPYPLDEQPEKWQPLPAPPEDES